MLLEGDAELSLRRQAAILGIPRTGLYYEPVLNDRSELANHISEIFLSSGCRYGYRKITEVLRAQGLGINHKTVLKIMREMGIEGLYPKRSINTSKGNRGHEIYPYLLDKLVIDRANMVWATDITYIRIGGRFMYFMAIMDLHSRYIISHELSYNMEAEFCARILERALELGSPEIFNTDQGAQYTSKIFIKMLLDKQIKISMNHKGRCFDNIRMERLWRTFKQESIYYYRAEDISSLEKQIDDFVLWYNNKRLHQGLSYKTPREVYLGNMQG